MKVLSFLLVITVFLGSSACGGQSGSDGPPILEHDQVIFSNGRKVRFEDDKIYLQDDIIRPVLDKPVTKIERAMVVPGWKRVIVETEYGYYEDGGYVFRFYDFSGRLLKQTVEYFGSFRQLLMKNHDRLILVQRSSHYELSDGHILDTDGNEVGTITQKPRAYDAALSKEGDLFHIIYRRRSQGIAFWTVDVLDAAGTVLASQDFKTGGTYTIEIGERKIGFSLSNPK